MISPLVTLKGSGNMSSLTFLLGKSVPISEKVKCSMNTFVVFSLMNLFTPTFHPLS